MTAASLVAWLHAMPTPTTCSITCVYPSDVFVPACMQPTSAVQRQPHRRKPDEPRHYSPLADLFFITLYSLPLFITLYSLYTIIIYVYCCIFFPFAVPKLCAKFMCGLRDFFRRDFLQRRLIPDLSDSISPLGIAVGMPPNSESKKNRSAQLHASWIPYFFLRGYRISFLFFYANTVFLERVVQPHVFVRTSVRTRDVQLYTTLTKDSFELVARRFESIMDEG